MSLSYRKGTPIAIIKSKNKKMDKKFIKVIPGDEGVDEITLNKGDTLQVLPLVEEVQRLYVAGPSGSGKSYFISKWLGLSRKIWKGKNKREIYIFSRIINDHQLDKFNPIRPDLEEMIDDPMTGEELQNAIVIFDDIDSIADRDVKNAIYSLQKDLLVCGRHFNVTVICTSHLISNNIETKYCLNESSGVVIFPRSGQTYQIKRYLKEYQGFEKKMINKVMKLPSRWVYIHKSYPQTVIYEGGVFMGCMDL